MNKKITLGAVVIASSILAGCASTSTDTTATKKMENISYWNTVGADVWSVSNGTVSASPVEGKSYLVSPQAYKNYILELEFKPDADVNSGVFINCGDATKIGSKNCYEANISDNHKKPEFRTGSIVRHAAPISKANTIGKWNTLKFTSNNGTITAEVNGVANTITSNKHPAGHIGLQRFKNGVIQFRNISITEL